MIRILVAEDQALVRGALSMLLGLEEDFAVVGEAKDGMEAVCLAEQLQPDIALLDIEMPRMSGLEAILHLAKRAPNCKCIMVTTFARPGYMQRAVKAGARGYLLKDAEVEELAAAIRKVVAGEKVMRPELMMAAWEMTNPLTERELEVLQQAAKDIGTKELAKALCLSEGTVRNYLSEIMAKLRVQSRQEAVSFAEAQGWL